MTDIATLGLEVRSDGVVVASDRLKTLQQEGGRAETATNSLTSSFGNLSKYIQAAVAALAAWKLSQYISEATILAARVETLGVVMKVVGNNAGYTSTQMDAFTNQVKKMGITTQESMNSLIKMAGAQMDLNKSSALARVAQDAAVIGGINSSEAFGRMIQGIRSGETEILKTIGINVQFDQSYKKMAESLGKHTDQLSNTEKVTARMNAVLDYGKNINGAYEASMSTAGKQMLSMARYTEELKLAIGEITLPVLTMAVWELIGALKNADHWMKDNKSTLLAWGDGVVTMYGATKNIFLFLASALDEVGVAAARAWQFLLIPGAVSGNQWSKDQMSAAQDYIEMMKKRVEANRIERQAILSARAVDGGAVDSHEAALLKGGAYNKDESKRIAQGQAARDAEEKARLAAEAVKNAEKEVSSYNQFVVAFNAKMAAIEEANPLLTAHEKALMKISDEEAKMIEAHPKEAKEIEKLFRWVKQTTEEYQRLSDIMAAEGHDDAADNWSKNFDAAGKAMTEFFKSYNAALRLQIDLDLIAIDTQEKFYNLTSGEAANQRIAKLQESVKLETEAFNQVEEANTAEETRLQLRIKIAQLTEKIAAEQKKIYDTTAIGGMTNAIQEYGKAATDVGAQTKSIFLDAFKGIEDAITKFVQTSKLSMKSLLQSIQADLIKMTISKPITNYLAQQIGALGSKFGGNNVEHSQGYVDAGGSSTSGVNASNYGAVIGTVVGIYSVVDAVHKSDKARAKEMSDALKMQQTINASILSTKQGLTGDIYASQITDLKIKQSAQLVAVYDVLDKATSANGKEVGQILSDTSAAGYSNPNGWAGGVTARGISQNASLRDTWVNLLDVQEKELQRLKDKQAQTTNNLRLTEMELLGQKGSAEYLKILASVREAEMFDLDNSAKLIQQRIYKLQDEKEALEKVTTAISKTVDIAISAANAIKDIQGGSLSTDSPEMKYRKAIEAFRNNTDGGKAGELGKAALSASQQYNASGSGYQADYLLVMSKLQEISGTQSGVAIDPQITLLQGIKDAIELGTNPALKKLSVGSTITNIITAVQAPTGGYQLDYSQVQKAETDISNVATDWWKKGTSFLGFASGSAYIPYDMPANIHQGEMIIDRASSDVLRKYGVPTNGSADNKETNDLLREQNKLLLAQVAELRALVGVTRAGAVGTIQAVEKGNDNKAEINGLRLKAAA